MWNLKHGMGFPCGSMVKNLPAMQETQVRSWGQEDPLEKEMATYSSILAGEFHGQRSLTGYSSWGFNELDMTERLTLSLSLHFVILQLNIVITTYGLPFPCFIMSLREILHLGMPERKSF